MGTDQLATALRVLGTAVGRGLVVDRPATVDIYAHGLEPQEIRWLYSGMADPTIDILPRTTVLPQASEDVQIVGKILAWPVRILLVGRNWPGLLGDLSQALADRTIKAHAAAVSAP